LKDPTIKIKTVDITGLASHIPTSFNQAIVDYDGNILAGKPAWTGYTEENNTYLSKARAVIAEKWIKDILKENNYDLSSVTVTKNNSVEWPAWDTKYSNPADAKLLDERVNTYWPYQGVEFKITYDKQKTTYNYTLEKTMHPLEIDDPMFWLTTEIIVPKSIYESGKPKDVNWDEFKAPYLLLQLSENAAYAATPGGWAEFNRGYNTLTPESARLKVKNAVNKDITDETQLTVNTMNKWKGERVKNTPVLVINDYATFQEINKKFVEWSFTAKEAARIIKRMLKEQAKAGLWARFTS
jgi:hypothetical protein